MKFFRSNLDKKKEKRKVKVRDFSEMPLTDDERAVLKHIETTVNEFDEAIHMPLAQQQTLWEAKLDAYRHYLGDQEYAPPRYGLMSIIHNRTQASIQTIAANQLSQPLRIIVSPVETNEPANVYLTKKGLLRMKRAALPGGPLERDSVRVNELSAEQGYEEGSTEAESILANLEPSQGPMGEYVPPILEKQDVIQVDDQAKAELLQKRLDVDWQHNFADLMLMENQTNTIIGGDQLMLFNWDNTKHTWCLDNPHWQSYRLDPLSTFSHNGNGPVVVKHYRVDEAKAMWPKMAGEIEDLRGKLHAGNRGLRSKYSGVSGYEDRIGAAYHHVENEDGLLAVTTTWFRDQPYVYMTVEEAEKAGLIEVANVPMSDGVDVEGGFIPIQEPDGEIAHMPEYTLVENDSPTFPESSNWPVRKAKDDEKPDLYGIRQVQVNLDHGLILFDGPCPFQEIPAVTSKCSWIPYSPYGIGEPFRLQHLDYMINRLLTVMGNMVLYYQYPQMVVPNDLKEEIQQTGEELYAHAGQVIGMDRDDFLDYFAKGGVNSFHMPVPEIPQVYFQLLGILLSEHASMSMDQDVLRGQAPSSEASGKLVQALADNAKGVIAHKARGLEYVAEWIARLAIQSYIDFLPDEEWEKTMAGSPEVVRKDILSSLRDIKFDVKVEAIYGRGSSRDIRYRRAMEGWAQNLVGRKDTLEALEVPDADGVIARRQKENKEEMQLAQTPMMPGAAPQVVPEQNIAGMPGAGQQVSPDQIG